MHLELKIELLGISEPTVWRHIKISPEITFHQLHQIIQAAFGWRDSHLYEFSENGIFDLIRICGPYTEEAPLLATDTSANQMLFDLYNSYLMHKGKHKKMIYTYDYGDCWEHKITVVNFDRTASGRPEIMDGGGACPPEDCGGIHGFEDLKVSLKTGQPSAIHGESWIPWLEGTGYKNYDPNNFDLGKARKRIKRGS